MSKVTILLKNKRRIFSGFVAGLVALCGLLIMPASVHASVASGTSQLAAGAGQGIITWNANNDSLSLYSAPGTLASGKCGDAIFDWHRDDFNPLTSNHHDARIVRVCRSGATHSTSIGTDTGGSLQGMQKSAFCVGNDNATTSGTCNNDSRADQIVQGNVNVSIPNNCVRAWKKNANGTTVYYSGGASTSCTS
ncbi:MAG TPA: hypothetical protein VJ836_02150 [Candidatus Saccharimonadales bacterium]|nr:hypothetical protein [Candidatus Saccharimonadales bacterium]